MATALAILSALVQAFRLPPVLGGADLRVLAGSVRDPHVLTWLVDRGVVGACHLSAPCTHAVNAIGFAVAVAVFGWIFAWRTKDPFVVALATGIVGTAPLAQGAIVDPLGLAQVVMFGIFVLAAFDIGGVVLLPTWGRCLVAASLALQDPLMGFAALLYSTLAPRRSVGEAAFPFACALVASLVALAIDPSLVPTRGITIDALAGPLTIILVGICLFAVAPVALYLSKRGAFTSLELPAGRFLRLVALGAAALFAAMFAPNGDPSVYWFAFEATLVVAIAPAMEGSPRATRILVGALAVTLAFQASASVAYRRQIPSRVIAYQSGTLLDLLTQSSSAVCLSSDKDGDDYVLADGALERLYPSAATVRRVSDPRDCLGREPNAMRLITIHGIYVEDWGAALAVVRAFDWASNAALVFPQEKGLVSPRTLANTPNHRGAFGNVYRSPVGPVSTFTVLSGYEYRFGCIAIPADGRIAFAAAIIPGSPPLDLSVAIGTSQGQKVVLTGAVQSSRSATPATWKYFSTGELPEGNCSTVSFRVTSLGGATGQWLTFAGAAVR